MPAEHYRLNDSSFSPPLEKRSDVSADLKNPANWLLSLLGAAASSTGITVTPLRMLGVATTFACIRVMSKTMASLPLILYKGAGDGDRVMATDSMVFSVCHDAPNDEMSIFDFVASMQANLSLRQNAYAEVLRNADGDVTGMYPIEPSQIYPYRDAKSKRLKYQFQQSSTVFEKEEILHLKGFTRNGLVGIDNTITLQEVFALAIALQDNAAKFFGNGSRPGGILEHPEVLGEEAQQRIKEQFKEATSGVNAYQMMILEEGMKYSATRSENKDSQFQEAREYQDLQICRVFGVPPHKVGIAGNMPRANVEEENIGFVTDTVRPECVLWEKALGMRLLTSVERSAGYHFEFDLDALLRGKLKEQHEAFQLARNGGWMNVNEIRRKLRMNGIGAIGDIYLQPVNYVPLGTLPAPPPAAAGKVGPDGKALPAPKPAPVPAAPEADIEDEGSPEGRVEAPISGKPQKLLTGGDDTNLLTL